MIIQHNMASMFANGKLNISEKRRADSTEKLSSGYRINRSADDAAGLSISEKMRWQIRGLNKASQNIADGMSLLQVADGALNESHAVLQRMNELAVQAANDTNTDVDRDAIQLEMDELSEELTRIAETTSFNSEIYPLASDGVQKVQGLSGIKEVSFTILNDSGSNVACNGVTYKNGETIVVNNVVWLEGGQTRATMVSYANVTSFGYNSGVIISLNTYKSTWTMTEMFRTNNFYPNIELNYVKMSDVQEDENGYLYMAMDSWDPLGFTDRCYFQQGRGMFPIMVNGREDVTPPAQECEARNVLRKNTNTVQTPDLIKIQSSALANQSIDIPLVNATAANLGVEYLDVMTHTNASKAITTINDAIAKVSEYRSMFGALQNRLEHAQANVDNTMENTQDAESKLRDTNMAEEMVNNSAASIISQAAQSMLAQSNVTMQGVLQLLK